MSRQATCCFTGHRDISPSFGKELLKNEIIKLIEHGVDTFIAGGALGFDTLAALCVLSLKRTYPHIKLHIYAPCSNQSERWSFSQKRMYENILKSADYVDMPSAPYYDGCMKDRNYKMVDNSGYCICYHDVTNYRSGTGQTVRYAQRSLLKIVNLFGE